MAQDNHKQFYPVAMAAEVLCTRWTVALLCELVAGSTRFNDLRHGVPRMSPRFSQRSFIGQSTNLHHTRTILPEPIAIC